MPMPGLLSIDPDKLFVHSSILEIEDVQKKLQLEIERKREELRTMVGERYRDLIEAADTISQMKTLSERVIDDVNSMKIATVELQERQVSGFKLEHHIRLIFVMVDLHLKLITSLVRKDIISLTLVKYKIYLCDDDNHIYMLKNIKKTTLKTVIT
uniref:Conserved oligomeric Golgi complex subunit 1 n=1 Tax=Graphocephala atropunctata TaxID=36148 RepID=A0A1B6KR39_9HEMI